VSAVAIVVALVAAERLAELALARRNTRALLRQGAVESGRGHYPLLVLLHAAWLGALLLLVPGDAPVVWPWLALFVALQAARLWVIWSLGPWWTTRIVSLPGAPLVRRGPYRLMRHPNYAVVAAEIAVLPLAFAAWPLALVFSLLNAVLLAWRVAVEERALAQRRRALPPP
jgi:methyltransferase